MVLQYVRSKSSAMQAKNGFARFIVSRSEARNDKSQLTLVNVRSAALCRALHLSPFFSTRSVLAITLVTGPHFR
jgi:hypothetical protein